MLAPFALAAPPPLSDLGSGRPVALFLDFDGTLVDIADRPDEIVVPSHLARRIEQLARLMNGRLALISGRALGDLAAHLGPVAIYRAGSHGIERLGPDGAPFGDAPEPFPYAARRTIAAFATRHPAIELEEKTYGVALHFRAQPDLESDAVAFARGITEHGELRLKRGKCVVEVVRDGADKAGAVRAFMDVAPFAGAVPVFIGDDVTDEDGFRAASELGGCGILVGEPRETRASFILADPAAVHSWLRL